MPPDTTDHELLHVMRRAARPLSAGSGGSHTEVLAFDSDRLGENLAAFAAERGGSPEQARAQGREIGRRYLVKVGNISNYVIKLSGGRDSIIRRHIVSEVMGPIGYNMAPNLDKVHLDTREAIREIPYFAWGAPDEQFAPDLLAGVRAAVTGAPLDASPEGTFLVQEGPEGRSFTTAYQSLAADPFFDGDVGNFEALTRFQDFLRSFPFNTTLKDRMRAFFDAPITVGFRDTLRFLEGSRHPALGWESAERIIRDCFAEFGRENFLPPEINYYTHSIAQSRDEVLAIDASNHAAAEALAQVLIERFPFAWTTALSDAELTALAAGMLELHHEYPVFEIEPYSGILSAAGARFLIRLVAGTAVHVAGLDVPERRNAIAPGLVDRVRPVAAFVERLDGDQRAEFYTIANAILWELTIRGGVPAPDGTVRQWRRVDRTFYSFQERA